MPREDDKLPPLARWSLSGLAVAAIHGGALWMALNWVAPSAPMGLPDQPIMIEMDPVATPEETPPSVAPPGPEVLEETPPVAAPREAEPPQPDPPPKPERPEIAPEPPIPPMPPTPPVAEAEAVLPPKPKVRPPKPAVTKRVERKQTRERRRTAPAAVPAPRREQPASAGVPTVSAASRATWQSQVAAHLNRYKRSPANGATGTARVAFRIGSGGQVLSASLTGSSGDPALDQEAVALVRRASPLPAPPAGMGRVVSLAVPVRFTR